MVNSEGSRFRSVVRNLVFSARAVRRSFPDSTMAEIEQAISAAETAQSCEIRFVVEGGLPIALLRGHDAVRRRALNLFSALGVWDTGANNGILFYVLLAERRFEIIADRAVTAVVGEGGWQGITSPIGAHFAAGRWKDGAVEGIRLLSTTLAPHFPPEKEKKNELPDTPVTMR